MENEKVNDEDVLLLRYKQLKQTIKCKSNKAKLLPPIKKIESDCLVKIKWGKVYLEI
jgi:hypothetical protein